jgi:galactokinase
MSFEQAALKVDKEVEFEELKSAVVRALGPEKVERFLKQVRSNNLRVRDVDGVLAKRLLEKVDEVLAKSGKTAQDLYQALPVSDQAQMREFYLSKVEEVKPELRTKFQKLYQYY